MRKADVSDTGLAQATPGGIWRISPPAAGCAKGNTRYGRGRAPLRPQQLARTGDSARVMILKPDVRAKIDFKRLLQHLPRHPLRGTHRDRAIGACGEIDHEPCGRLTKWPAPARRTGAPRMRPGAAMPVRIAAVTRTGSRAVRPCRLRRAAQHGRRGARSP